MSRTRLLTKWSYYHFFYFGLNRHTSSQKIFFLKQAFLIHLKEVAVADICLKSIWPVQISTAKPRPPCFVFVHRVEWFFSHYQLKFKVQVGSLMVLFLPLSKGYGGFAWETWISRRCLVLNPFFSDNEYENNHLFRRSSKAKKASRPISHRAGNSQSD